MTENPQMPPTSAVPAATSREGAERHFFRASAADFKKIPGSPIAYWVSQDVRNVFVKGTELSKTYKPVQGLITGDTDRFAKVWHEVSKNKALLIPASKNVASASGKKWFPYNKGGSFRKWYGNNEYVVNWESDGVALKNFKGNKGKLLSRPQNESTYFKEGLTWTAISSSYFAVRYCPEGSIGSNAGMMIFSDHPAELELLIGLLNSSLTTYLMSCLTQTLNFDQGIISRIPLLEIPSSSIPHRLIELGKVDWNSYETSWDCTSLSLLNPDYRQPTLKTACQDLRAHWQSMTAEMQRLEEENNRIFIDAYGLQDELTPDVPLEEITLTCNPRYRYGGGKTDEEYAQLQRTDTMKELVSYAVGCMMGRYSPDTPGLQFAGGTYDHEKACVAAPSFYPDADGILPVLTEAYFEEDAAARFSEFLKAVFGKEHLSENLRFVAEAVGVKGSESPRDTLRRFMANDFFKYHMRMYKKRPIYWLFSSGKEKAFQALVYLHRYTPTTLARMRTGYLHNLQNKMRARIEDVEAGRDSAGSTAQVTRINRDLAKMRRQLEELRIYDEKLHHYADQRIEIDLDDGVKHNYGLFGDLLAEVKAVTGDKK